MLYPSTLPSTKVPPSNLPSERMAVHGLLLIEDDSCLLSRTTEFIEKLRLRLELLKTERQESLDLVVKWVFLEEVALREGNSKEATFYAQEVRRQVGEVVQIEREIRLHFSFLKNLPTSRENNRSRQ